jgi:hypothetical protein
MVGVCAFSLFLAALVKAGRQDINKTGQMGTNRPFFVIVSRLSKARHPKDWQLCDGCTGSRSMGKSAFAVVV